MATTTSVARRIQASRRLVRDGATTDDVDRAKGRIDAVLSAFPGIVAERSGSRAQDDGFVVTCAIGTGDLGRAAALAVDFIAERVGAAPATDADTTRVRCSATQFVQLQNSLYYASELQVGRRPTATLSEPSLPKLLGRALGAFVYHYDSARGEDRSIPQLAVWANALRAVDAEGTDQRQLGRRTVISKRVAEVVVSRLERRGRVSVEAKSLPGRRGKARIVHLTQDGRAARNAAARLVDTVQEDWRQRFGNDGIVQLREALSSVVDRLPLELPHYVTGYGAGDPSVTGGDYVLEDPGPPRIPAHGQEWPVVIREPGSVAADLPLPALLSQVLAAFAIDYERERLGHLSVVSNFLRFVSDEGVTLERAQALGGVSGNGKTLHERHLDVVVEPGRARDKGRRVYLTPKGRRMRDAYPHLVTEVEQGWCEEYGDAVAAMRSRLNAMNEQFDDDLPDYPDTNGWIHRLWFD
ncbi:MAG: hypothetical protein OXU77_17390 [Gammaproteobacteria bacterium]|nr:hypothetical protein [Gammaproteobacteria bacterium]MDE0442024.1 hypothetical protein [Gammaproteobacteria bacterium]